MAKLVKEGRLTIRTCLYLDEFLVMTAIAFSMPITLTYFYDIIKPEIIAAAGIIFRLQVF